MKIYSQPCKGRVVMTGAELAATAGKEIPGNGLMYFGLMNGFKDQEHFAGGIKPLSIDEIGRLCERINQ